MAARTGDRMSGNSASYGFGSAAAPMAMASVEAATPRA